MPAYVSLSEQKEYSRIKHSALDTTISTAIEACSASVKNYLKDFSPYEGERDDDDDYVVDSNYEPVSKLDSSGNQIVKPEVKLAVFAEVDRYIRVTAKDGPDTTTIRLSTFGFLSDAAVALLHPLRDPALK